MNSALDFGDIEIETPPLPCTSRQWDGSLSPTLLPENVMEGLNQERDAYFTADEIAKSCFEDLIQFLESEGEDLSKVLFLETSAGGGAFFKLCEGYARIGLDIEPKCDGVEQGNFLEWNLPKEYKDHTLVVLGNPPFGKSGAMALLMMKRCIKMGAKYIAWILPVSFSSQNKLKRVKRDFEWIPYQTERVSSMAFINDDTQKRVDVNCAFQIWGADDGRYVDELEAKSVDEFIEIITIRKSPKNNIFKNVERIPDCDVFIKQSFSYLYQTHNICRADWEDREGPVFGIVIKKNHEEIKELLLNYDYVANWERIVGDPPLRPHPVTKEMVPCPMGHAGIQKISNVLIEAGFYTVGEKSVDDFVKIYGYSQSRVNRDRCDFFIQGKFWIPGDLEKRANKDFSHLLQTEIVSEKTVYWGIEILKDKEEISEWLKNVNLSEYTTESSCIDHGGPLCNSTRSNIEQIFVDGGFYRLSNEKICNAEVYTLNISTKTDSQGRTLKRGLDKLETIGFDFAIPYTFRHLKIARRSVAIQEDTMYVAVKLNEGSFNPDTIDWHNQYSIGRGGADEGFRTTNVDYVKQALIDGGIYMIDGGKTTRDYVDMKSVRSSTNVDKSQFDIMVKLTYTSDNCQVVFFDESVNDGTGLIIKKDKDRVIDCLQNTDWNVFGTPSIRREGFYSITNSNIENALIEGGLYTTINKTDEIPREQISWVEGLTG